ncbi:superoxide dismutase [Sphingomonas parva]|uniref:Superoxide dismutase n=1 Tax=Sphingomonas parva TaxID=2555898 RepID=A0A4Y8ZXU0_9SPHN|nr:superoxide dismutase [Sphingomonas parva]TFI59326.1 superoxide dismutase [Sphingomonas parva]
MPFILPELPFDKGALGDFMSAETLDYHHGKHHKAYVDKVNTMVGDKGLEGASLSQVIRAAADRGDAGLFNNSGQIWNHNFFWQCLAPPQGQRPSGKLAVLIEEGFGTTEAMLAKLKDEAVGHFASGWAWLVLDQDKLRITSLHDGDSPVTHEGMKPLLTVDVWEHAYYIDYRNQRPAFVDAVLNNLINWEFVAQNLDGNGIGRADQQG